MKGLLSEGPTFRIYNFGLCDKQKVPQGDQEAEVISLTSHFTGFAKLSY